MFMGPLEAVKPWSMKGVEGVYRFLGRAWRMVVDHEAEELVLDPRVQDVEPTTEQAQVVARTVAGVTDDLDGMRFNTAISKLMEFVNFFTGQEVQAEGGDGDFREAAGAVRASCGARSCGSCWGMAQSLAYEPWPGYDPALLRDEEIEIPVQVNGKVRGRIMVAADADRGELEKAAWEDPKIAALLEGKTVQKIVVVPGKLVSFVVS